MSSHLKSIPRLRIQNRAFLIVFENLVRLVVSSLALLILLYFYVLLLRIVIKYTLLIAEVNICVINHLMCYFDALQVFRLFFIDS